MRNTPGKEPLNWPLYGCTTEMVKHYVPQLVDGHEGVVAVAGSGDHVINAAYGGAKRILAFDSNLPALWWSQCKWAGMKTLSYGQFRSLFDRGVPAPPHRQGAEMMRALCRAVGGDGMEFLLSLFEMYDFDRDAWRQSTVFKATLETDTSLTERNQYVASEAAFLRAQRMMRRCEIEMLAGDVRAVASRLRGDRRYTVVLLSNIADYAARMFHDGDYLLRYFASVVVPLAREGATQRLVVAAYLYAVDAAATIQSPRSAIDSSVQRSEVCRQLGICPRYKTFAGVVRWSRDAVMIL